MSNLQIYKWLKIMNNIEISERKNTSISRAVGMMTQIYADRAENSEIWDVEGNLYIDFASGIAVVKKRT